MALQPASVLTYAKLARATRLSNGGQWADLHRIKIRIFNSPHRNLDPDINPRRLQTLQNILSELTN